MKSRCWWPDSTTLAPPTDPERRDGQPDRTVLAGDRADIEALRFSLLSGRDSQTRGRRRAVQAPVELVAQRPGEAPVLLLAGRVHHDLFVANERLQRVHALVRSGRSDDRCICRTDEHPVHVVSLMQLPDLPQEALGRARDVDDDGIGVIGERSHRGLPHSVGGAHDERRCA